MFAVVHFPVPGEKGATQEELAARVGLTRDQVRNALDQVPQWFKVLLRAEVREQVGADADVEVEIGELLGLLKQGE